MNLHLFDTSEYIYSGSRNLWILRGCTEVNESFTDAALPCGSLAYVLNTFFEWGGKNEVLVYCMDTPPVYKRALHEKFFTGGYKGGRKAPDFEIQVQKPMVDEMLQLMGANVVSAQGYEADDVIASMVKYYREDFDKIYIHAKDSDLFYLVDEKVEIMPLARKGAQKNSYNGKHIYIDNWGREVRKGIVCPRNILTLLKILDGEKSDNVPAVPRDMGFKIVDNIPRADYPLCGDNVFLRDCIKSITDNDPSTMAVVDLIQPVILPFRDVEFHEMTKDMPVFMDFAALSHCKYAHQWEYTKNKVCEAFIDKYMDQYLRGQF